MTSKTRKGAPKHTKGVKEAKDEDGDVIIDLEPLPFTKSVESSSVKAANDDAMAVDEVAKPNFRPVKESNRKTKELEKRKVPIPPHRITPLRKAWLQIYTPLVEHLKLQVRMNLHSQVVELRPSFSMTDAGALQKGADFVRAFALGFQAEDALTLLRMDDLYLDSFEIRDVKSLQGDHLSRAIGRIAGKDGKTKFTIENASRTRIVVADSKIHILGSFQNIKIARDAIVSLILGSPPGKVYATLRTISARMKERF